MSALLEIKNLRKSFPDNDGGEHVVIENLSLSVEKNSFLCILGPSGCGKTTLIRCIAGFEHYEGDVMINGEKKDRPNTERTMVFQEFNQLLPWKTVEKNIAYPLKLKGIKDEAERTEITDSYLEKVGLTDRKNHYPHQLSGGMKQRVAIARSLAVKPNIILMDEPFASLDAGTRGNLQNELLKLSGEEDMTVIFITHNIQEALILGTRILVMSQEGGDILLDEKPELKKPVTPSTEGYGEYWDKFAEAIGRK
jgi:NitT/TauT family transport system ATP-binding protein